MCSPVGARVIIFSCHLSVSPSGCLTENWWLTNWPSGSRSFWTFSRECMGEILPEIWHSKYSDYLQNWLDFGHGQMIFLISALYWLDEMRQTLHLQPSSWQWLEGIAKMKSRLSSQNKRRKANVKKAAVHSNFHIESYYSCNHTIFPHWQPPH